jgi:hypothetical protein
LPDLLNEALGITCFQRQIFRDLHIELWQNRASYPRELLPWTEGSTQVDTTITWENPPTTVFIEMKYGSALSPTTSRNQGQHNYPADQLVRNARVGLLECGFFQLPELFEGKQRDFLLLVVSPEGNQPLVTHYRNPVHLRAAIPHSDLIPRLPKLPFIGELTYSDVVRILKKQRRWFTRPEQILMDQLNEYLTWKQATRPRKSHQEHDISFSQQGRASCGG